MSTYAGQLEAAASASRRSLLERRATQQLIGVAGVLAGVGAGALIATSDHLAHPLGYGLLVADLVIGTAGVALYWLVRRPANRTGVILLLLAAGYAGCGLQGAADPVVHSIGVLFDPVIFTLAYWAVLAFPTGRLMTALDKALVSAPALVVLVGFLPWFFFSPHVSGGSPLAGCNALCPANGLMIADRPSVASALGRTESIMAAALAAAIVIAIMYRLARASRPRVRALLPVYVPALLLTIPFATFRAAGAGLIHLDATAVWRIGWVLTVGRGTLSYGFLLSIILSTMFAGRALKAAVGALGRHSHPTHLRSTLAEALDDPSLELAFAGSEAGGFTDSRGEAFDPRHVPTGQVATPVERDGTAIAYIAHDASLATDPELVRAAGQALLLTLESGLLQQEVDELRTSRARVAAAGQAERRMLERDLHDGAQQRLFALGLKLDHASRDAAGKDPKLAQELADVAAEVDGVLNEVRELGRGMYPPTLRDLGLERALASAAWRATQPTTVTASGLDRYSPDIEAAVYFCCLESLQNAARHSGAQAVEIRVWANNGDLCFSVDDDGVGYEAAQAPTGSGLANMRDRLAVFGGTLSVEPRMPHGTSVRGTLRVD
ncbi:MAG: sensor histidine kinase [Gaiellaceae bacterium]